MRDLSTSLQTKGHGTDSLEPSALVTWLIVLNFGLPQKTFPPDYSGCFAINSLRFRKHTMEAAALIFS
jgi:hypothetical protein